MLPILYFAVPRSGAGNACNRQGKCYTETGEVEIFLVAYYSHINPMPNWFYVDEFGLQKGPVSDA